MLRFLDDIFTLSPVLLQWCPHHHGKKNKAKQKTAASLSLKVLSSLNKTDEDELSMMLKGAVYTFGLRQTRTQLQK